MAPYHCRFPSPGHQLTQGLLPPPNCHPQHHGVATRLPCSLQNHWTPPRFHGIGPRWTPPTPHAPAPPQLLLTILLCHTQLQTLLAPSPEVIDLTGPDPNKSSSTPASLPRSWAPQVYQKVFWDPGSKGLPNPSERGFAYLGPPPLYQPLFWPDVP